jgi:hypothetical protein
VIRLEIKDRKMKINNEPQDKLLLTVTAGISIALFFSLGSIPGGGQYFGAFFIWIGAVFIWLMVARWIFKVNRRLACLEEIRELAAESSRQDLVRFQQNEAIKDLLRDIRDKL